MDIPEEIHLIIGQYVPEKYLLLNKKLRNQMVTFVLPNCPNNTPKTVKLLQKHPKLYAKFIKNYEVFYKYWTDYLCCDHEIVLELLSYHDVFDDRMVSLIHEYMTNYERKHQYGFIAWSEIARWRLACDDDPRIACGWTGDSSFIKLQVDAYRFPCYFEISDWGPDRQHFLNYTCKYRFQTLVNYVMSCNANKIIPNESPSCLVRILALREIIAAIDPEVIDNLSRYVHKELTKHLKSDLYNTVTLGNNRPAVYSVVRSTLALTAEKILFNKVIVQLQFAMHNRPFGVKLISVFAIAWDVKNYPLTAAQEGLINGDFCPNYFTEYPF